MIKCTDNGLYTCISKSGKPKSRWETSDEAIEQAKYLTKRFHSDKDTKLVSYKCSNCHHYHLTTTKKRKRF